MQYIITAHDFPDALPRRMECRQHHLDMHAALAKEGRMHYAAAIMNEKGEMAGSMIVCEFPDRAALEAYLAVEPYVLGKVWDRIDINPCKVAPLYAKK